MPITPWRSAKYRQYCQSYGSASALSEIDMCILCDEVSMEGNGEIFITDITL